MGTGLFRRIPWPVRHGSRLLVLALVVEYLVLPQLAGARNSLHLLLDVDNAWLLLALACELGSLVAFAATTRAVLPAEHRPSLWRVLRIDLSTVALSHCVPAGGAAGTALGLRLLTQAGVPVSDAAFAKIAQGLGAAVVLQLLLWSALAVAIPLHGAHALYVLPVTAGIAVVATVVTVVVFVRRGRGRLARIADAVTRRLPHVDDGAGSALVEKVSEQVDTVLAGHRPLVAAALWSAANWLLDAATLWCCLRAYGHSFGYDGLMVPFGIANTLAWLPVTPGGLGIVEGVLVPLLVGFGSTRGVAVLGVITWRLASFWMPIPLGGAAYASLTHTRLRRGLRRLLGWPERALDPPDPEAPAPAEQPVRPAQRGG